MSDTLLFIPATMARKQAAAYLGMSETHFVRHVIPWIEAHFRKKLMSGGKRLYRREWLDQYTLTIEVDLAA